MGIHARMRHCSVRHRRVNTVIVLLVIGSLVVSLSWLDVAWNAQPHDARSYDTLHNNPRPERDGRMVELDRTAPIVVTGVGKAIKVTLTPHEGTIRLSSVDHHVGGDNSPSDPLNTTVTLNNSPLFSIGFSPTHDTDAATATGETHLDRRVGITVPSDDFTLVSAVRNTTDHAVTLHFTHIPAGMVATWSCRVHGHVATLTLSVRERVAPLDMPPAVREAEGGVDGGGGGDTVLAGAIDPNNADIERYSRVAFVDLLSFPSSLNQPHHVAGTVQGCPMVFDAARVWFGIEHPMSNISTGWVDGQTTARMPWFDRPLSKYPVHNLRAAFGAYAADNQLRRSFNDYLEGIRAVPWRPWLHYNSWYQLRRAERMKGVVGFRHEDEMTEPNVLRVMSEFNDKLVRPGHIDTFRGFLLDDGWDNYDTLWQVDTNEFPSGFQPLAAAARRMHLGSIGVWLSPWGGYEAPRAHREQYGRTQGFETNRNGFSLAGPKYFHRFLETAVRFVRDHGVTFFKFDGIAGGFVTDGPPREFVGDVFGLFELVRQLRRLKDDLFINLTVGTWPSPYLLTVADSIWRGDMDTGGRGRGSKIQRWITYRDMIVHKLVVRRSELFPISSLMLHGAVLGDVDGFAQQVLPEPHLPADEVAWDWACELWSFFASGANLQELYITPRLMTPVLWQVVIDAVKFGETHATILHDSHMIGGNPEIDEPYGWASFDPTSRQGVVGLRNPDTKTRTMTVCPFRDLELYRASEALSCVGTLVWGQRKPRSTESEMESHIHVPQGTASHCWPEIRLPPHQLLVYTVHCP